MSRYSFVSSYNRYGSGVYCSNLVAIATTYSVLRLRHSATNRIHLEPRTSSSTRCWRQRRKASSVGHDFRASFAAAAAGGIRAIRSIPALGRGSVATVAGKVRSAPRGLGCWAICGKINEKIELGCSKKCVRYVFKILMSSCLSYRITLSLPFFFSKSGCDFR